MLSVLGLLGPQTPPYWYQRSHASTQQIPAPVGPYEDESIFDSETLQGNMAVAALTVAPSAVGVIFPTGGLPVLADTTSGRQTFSYSEYAILAKNWVAVTGAADGITSTYAFNNVAPIEVTAIPSQQWYTNIPITPIILGDYVTDADDAEDLLTYTGLAVGGLSVASATYGERNVKQIEGTPSGVGSGTVNLVATDPFLEALNLTGFAYTTGAGVLLPQVDEGSTDIDDGADEITAVTLPIIAILRELDAADPGIIIDQDPEGGVYVAPGTEVTLHVSAIETPSVSAPGTLQATAVSAIQAADLVEQVILEYSDTVPEGEVISQFPDADVLLLPGEIVIIRVSDGENPVGASTGFGRFLLRMRLGL